MLLLKRPSESTEDRRVFKAPKYTHNLTLVSLPTEILDIIFSHLTKQDIINLSTLDYDFRKNLIPVVLLEVLFTWKQIIQRSDDFFEKYKYLIQQVRISDSNSLHEWNYDVFTELLIRLPNLKRLLIHSQSSSNWLKYRQHDNLEQLTLYCVNHNVGLFSPMNNKFFSLDHVANFKMLKRLELHNYRFYRDLARSYPVLIIEDIALINCSWDFPFEISQLNYNENIRRLTLRNSGNDSFIVSERYRYFLESEVLKSLEELEISITEGKLSSSLNCTMVSRFMKMENFPSLLKLRFRGWNTTYNISHWFNKLPENNTLQVLELKLDSEVDDKERSQRECKKYFSNLKLELD
ncbi:hypothetical protein Cantr_06538 [Candida viswanathii]|uniref:F-box domain-containing protein n=1 Tax=Candida viswanathii TaxID=5486 RepID=A0A367XYV5_9ASCO|nr:hypothetical protein Cantr_06538 [Candida viswanathii]